MEGKIYEKGVLENRRAGGGFSLPRLFSLEPPKDWVLGVDLSHWNGVCNFALMKSKGVQFGVTKATDVGWGSKLGFVDSKAVHNYTEMGKVGFLRSGYHWLDPRNGSPEYQADFYLDNFYSRHPTEMPPVLDFEDNDFIDPNDMLWRAQVWLETVEEKTGRLPIVYTSNGYMAKFPKSKVSFLAKYPLWIAHYIQRTYPSIPFPWTKAKAWQYSDKGDFPYYKWGSPTTYGKDWGSGSFGLDMNWWMDTYEELLAFCGGITLPTPPVSNVLFRAKFIKWFLNTRAGAGTGYPINGYLVRGQVVSVYEEKSGWYRIDPIKQVWCSGSTLYMQKL